MTTERDQSHQLGSRLLSERTLATPVQRLAARLITLVEGRGGHLDSSDVSTGSSTYRGVRERLGQQEWCLAMYQHDRVNLISNYVNLVYGVRPIHLTGDELMQYGEITFERQPLDATSTSKIEHYYNCQLAIQRVEEMITGLL